MGEPVGDNAWAIRVHVKPFVRWVWLGGLMIAAAGFLTLLDRRYRRVRQRIPRPKTQVNALNEAIA